MGIKSLAIWAAFALSSASAAVLDKRATCSSYTIINTRGTGEAQGESWGFRTMNGNILEKLGGGKIYNTVYPAADDQNSASGSQDIVNKIKSTLKKNPKECFVLEGYSQGAAATVNALSLIPSSAFPAVKAVFLIGNPQHKAGLKCNVGRYGGKATLNVDGLSAYGDYGVPAKWVAKTLDVCIKGDGVCDTTNGNGLTPEHGEYPGDASVQGLGTRFVTKKLRSG